MKGLLNYHKTLISQDESWYEGTSNVGLWLIGGSSYHLNAPLSKWHNGSTYVVGYEDNIHLNQVWIIKQTGFNIQKNKVGNGTIAEEPNNHATPILVIDDLGYIYVIQNEFHVAPFRVWKSDNPEDITSFTRLADFDTNGAYITLMKQNNRDCYFVTRSADSGETPNFFYNSILHVDLNDPATYTKLRITDNNYTGTQVRHYASATFFYGTSNYRVGGINHRNDVAPITNYKTSLWVTQDFDTYQNIAQTFTKNVAVDGFLTPAELDNNFSFDGSDSNKSIFTISFFIQVNNDVYIAKNYKTIEKLTIGTAGSVAVFTIPFEITGVVNLYYNGENIVLMLMVNGIVQIYTIDTNLMPASFKYQRNIDTSTDIFYTGLPYNLNQIPQTGEYLIIGRSEVGNPGVVPYIITKDKFKSVNTSPVFVTQITDLTANNIKGKSINITWSAPSALNPIIGYELYLNNVLTDTVSVFTYQFTGLIELTSYTIKVRAFDDFGNFSNFDEISVSTVEENVSDYLVSYWKTEGNALDSVDTNHGTETDISYVAGLVGQTAVFNGTTSKIDAPNVASSPEISITMLIKLNVHTPTVAAKTGLLVMNTSNAVNHYPYIGGGGTIYCSLLTSVRKTIGVGVIANRAAWHTITVTANTNTNVWKFYQNDQLVFTDTVGTLTLTPTISIGNSSGNWWLDGQMDEISIFNKELTLAEVSEVSATLLSGQHLL